MRSFAETAPTRFASQNLPLQSLPFLATLLGCERTDGEEEEHRKTSEEKDQYTGKTYTDSVEIAPTIFQMPNHSFSYTSMSTLVISYDLLMAG